MNFMLASMAFNKTMFCVVSKFKRVAETSAVAGVFGNDVILRGALAKGREKFHS